MSDLILGGNGKAEIQRALDAIGIQYVDVQLSNDQILHLKASPVEFIPAPGVGLAINRVSIHGVLDTRNGSYTDNGGNDPFLVLIYATDVDSASPEAKEAAYEPFGGEIFNLGAGLFSQEANAGTTFSSPTADFRENQPLTLLIGDMGHGGGETELGGGHSSNTLSLRFWYSIVSTVPF